MKELYVVNCCRTAVGSFGGSLKNTPAAELGAIVVKEALKRANVAPENVDELMFGCILTSGLGQNVARQVGVGAGLPYSVPAYTVGMVCGSGMKSVIEGARAILSGDANIVVCGGTENMSAAPFASPDARWGARMGDKKIVDTMIRDGLWDAFNNYHMGTTAENINDIWGITRREQDEFAAASQQKACAARDSGRFDDEIVPVPVKVKKEIVEFKKDEFPRAGSTAEGLAKLRGAFPVGPESPNPEVVHTFEVTGAQDAAEKERTLAAFSAGEIDVLIATTVIEVGVNVPSATVMVIENADRFGLSQLHQLRGRVGRGAQESWCFLMAEPNERLTTLCSTNDGFEIARKDLELRGPGEFLGTVQHGAGFLSGLAADGRLLAETQQCMRELRQNPDYHQEYEQVLAQAQQRFAARLPQVALN